MKSQMVYGANTYGNTENAPQYKVTLKRAMWHKGISIVFNFEQPAEGRGVGTSRGSVRSVSLELPASTAEALSHALQLALSDTASSDLAFTIDEGAKNPVAQAS